MARYARGFFPPQFADWRYDLSELAITLQIALWGTALAIVGAVPLSLLASANLTPWWAHQPIRRALAEIVFGVIPQVIPLWASYALCRFESNVRSASVVGMVGAVGIGMVLWDVIRGFQYGQTAAVLLLLIASVSVIDLVSAQLRKRLV